MERQIVKYYSTYKIPTYAVCALEYGEYDDGLDDADIKNIQEFEKQISEACPEGYLFDWGGEDNESYFACDPAFGKSTDVVDLKVCRIINTELKDADINNKDVCDEFDWLMDNWEGVETESAEGNGIYRILFWKYNCACRLKYRFNDNWFDVEIIDAEGGNFKAAVKELKELLHSGADCIDTLYLSVKTDETEDSFKAHCEYSWIMKLIEGDYEK